MTPSQGCEVCRDCTEYRSVCIRKDQQRRTNFHGTTSKFDAKPSGPTGLRNCKCPNLCTAGNLRRKPLEKTENSAKGNIHWRRSRLTVWNCPLESGCTHSPPKRGRRRKRLWQTRGQQYSTKEKSQESTRWTNKKKSILSMTTSWIQIAEKTSTLANSTPRTVRTFWIRLPYFQKCETDVWTALKSPNTASN